MKEPHEVRPSQSLRPRVMRVGGQPPGRSVHRGTTGPCIELRKHPFVVADLVPTRGRQQRCRTIMASSVSPPRSLRPRARLETFFAEAGRPRKRPFRVKRIGRRRQSPQVRRVRFRGVRQFHSTKEADEQRWPDGIHGAGGGKGTGQGERRAVATGPDTAPDTQVARTVGRASGCTTRWRAVHSLSSKARAVCGSSARTDLREGRPARAGPIAIVANQSGRQRPATCLISRPKDSNYCKASPETRSIRVCAPHCSAGGQAVRRSNRPCGAAVGRGFRRRCARACRRR